MCLKLEEMSAGGTLTLCVVREVEGRVAEVSDESRIIALLADGPMTPPELMAAMDMKQRTMARRLEGLESDGRIVRTPGKSRQPDTWSLASQECD